MNLLDHPLIKKYFEHGDDFECLIGVKCEGDMAVKVLAAMQEPVQRGELILVIGGIDIVSETTAVTDIRLFFHPFCLRLPDQFQTGQFQ